MALEIDHNRQLGLGLLDSRDSSSHVLGDSNVVLDFQLQFQLNIQHSIRFLLFILFQAMLFEVVEYEFLFSHVIVVLFVNVVVVFELSVLGIYEGVVLRV